MTAGELVLHDPATYDHGFPYEHFRELHFGPRWDSLRADGARPQRCLWASTSTKNPRYRDVRYVEELVGPDTVNTMPPATLGLTSAAVAKPSARGCTWW